MTPFEKYQEAIKFLSDSVDSFDQFRSCLKDCGIGGIASNGRTMESDWRVAQYLENMLATLKSLNCDCGQPLAAHNDAACQFDGWHKAGVKQ